MSGPAYRSETEEDAVREASVGDLLPATRERLRQACENGEALLRDSPRAVGRPADWGLATFAGGVVLAAPLFATFGRLESGPFAAHGAGPPVLLAACLWVLGFGSMALRARWLRRGGLASGWYLFASGLVEVSGRRVRLWPASRLLRIEQRGATVTLDLGPQGQVQLTGDEPDVAATYTAARERLAQAESAQDSATVGRLDPLLGERAGAGWRALAGPVRLPATRRHGRKRPPVGWLLAALLVPASVALSEGARHLSDDLAIQRARRLRDTRSLGAYVAAAGRRAEQADAAWLELALVTSQDEPFVDYLRAPSTQRHELADDALAARVLGRATLDGLDLPAAVDGLLGYLAVGQRHRDEVDERLLRLSLRQAAFVDCFEDQPLLINHPDHSAGRGETMWRSHTVNHRLARGQKCHCLADLEQARLLARSPEQVSATEAALVAHFRAIQFTARTDEYLPRALVPLLDELLSHLAAHPQTALRLPSLPRQGLQSAASPGDDSWEPLVVVRPRPDGRTDWFVRGFYGHLALRELFEVKSPPGGPRLVLQPGPLERTTIEDFDSTDSVEASLSLPGGTPRRWRLKF